MIYTIAELIDLCRILRLHEYGNLAAILFLSIDRQSLGTLKMRFKDTVIHNYDKRTYDLLFTSPLENIPLHLNHEHLHIRLITKWRLEIGK